MNVYVRLIGEGVDVWRPVPALPIVADVVQLSANHEDRDIEVLEFLPGQVVRCEDRRFDDGQVAFTAVEQVEQPGVKQPFLACHDYGQGGIWVIVQAESGSSVRTKYPELDIIPRVPDWMTPEVMVSIWERNTYELESEPSGFLATLVQHRPPAWDRARCPTSA